MVTKANGTSSINSTTTVGNKNDLCCCIPLNDDTQYSLPLAVECTTQHHNGVIPFRSLEGILEENLDGTVHPSPVQIYGSDDAFLLCRSTLPAISSSDDSSGNTTAGGDGFDGVVVSDEERRRLFEEEMARAKKEEDSKEHSISGIELKMDHPDDGGDDTIVDINIYQPQRLTNQDEEEDEKCDDRPQERHRCACANYSLYQGDWNRMHRQTTNHPPSISHNDTYKLTNENECNTSTNTNTINGDSSNTTHSHQTGLPLQQQPSIRLIDLTLLQSARRKAQTQHHTSSQSRPANRHTSEPQTKPEPDLASKLRMDTPGRVFHVLRSILSCPTGGSHCASPWNDSYTSKHNLHTSDSRSAPKCTTNNQVIAILLHGHPSDNEPVDENHKHGHTHKHAHKHAHTDYFDALEQKEIEQFLTFRTGDASSSYYLYSYAALRNGSHTIDTLRQHTRHDIDPSTHPTTAIWTNDVDADGNDNNDYGNNPTTVLFYSHIPQRGHVSHTPPLTNGHQRSPLPLPKGCLWEEFQRITASQPSSLLSLSSFAKNRSSDDDNSDAPSSFELVHRIVAPPYQSHTDIYPGLLDHFLTPENLAAMTHEASSIPQWTAWPETSHYSSTNTNDHDRDNSNDDGTTHRHRAPKPPASWSVFPLCHTFPATDPTNRKWIPVTCGYVPHTARLLKQIGAPLRTALFSRLEPGTTLGAHRGWADLANHVLRLHIPLIVPPSSLYTDHDHDNDNDNDCDHRTTRRPKTAEGLCGTWVDGCVETHREGEIICFDDSKIHRAFNYNPNEERVVLILDLARPTPSTVEGEKGVIFPDGTSTGAHTDELDKFIKQFV